MAAFPSLSVGSAASGCVTGVCTKRRPPLVKKRSITEAAGGRLLPMGELVAAFVTQ